MGSKVFKSYCRLMETIEAVMQEGHVKYPNDDWKDRETSAQHIKHAAEHIRTASYILQMGIKDEIDRATVSEELSHALTRITLSMAIFEEWIEEVDKFTDLNNLVPSGSTPSGICPPDAEPGDRDKQEGA